MTITVTVLDITGRRVDIVIEPTATLSELKQAYCDQTSVRVEDQIIVLNGRSAVGNHLGLHDLGIGDGTVVRLGDWHWNCNLGADPAQRAFKEGFALIMIHIKDIFMPQSRVVTQNATIKQVKQSYYYGDLNANALVEEHTLTFNDQQLDDDRSLSYYNIGYDSVLQLGLRDRNPVQYHHQPDVRGRPALRDTKHPSSRLSYLLGGAGIGAGFGALTGTALLRHWITSRKARQSSLAWSLAYQYRWVCLSGHL